MLKLFDFLYTSFMLNDQSTDSVVLKAKLQQQIHILCSIIAYNVFQKEGHDGKKLPPTGLFCHTYMVLRIFVLVIRPYTKVSNASASV